jgi:hypothetical protein
MTRTHLTRIFALAATLIAVAASPALAGDSAGTARHPAAPPDAFERAAARQAPGAVVAGTSTPAPDWPERAALARRAASVPTDVSDRVQLALLPGRSGLTASSPEGGGLEWAQVGLGALAGALLAGLAATGAGQVRRAVHG